jgi:6-phosphogluconate dehydrogenase (decarboxylating)
MIGLGRMGANMVRRLMRGGHELVVWDVNQDAVDELAGEGATGAPTLEEFVRKLDVSDSGEGRWTILAATDEGVPCHVLSSALFDRFESRGEAEYADKVLSAMRFGFGGHLEKPSD